MASIPHKFALLIPKKLARLPGIQYLPWKTPFRLLPQSIQLTIAEKVSNFIFRQQLADDDLCFLEDAILRLQIKDLAFDWQVSLQQQHLTFSPGTDAANTIFSGNSKEFLLLASRREDPDTLFFQRRLSIEGDTELGLQVKNLIDSVDMDDMPVALNHALYLTADFVEALPQ
ncbi:MAG: SCP2 sterol-binding domain-containing protein [Gammaproteobacteria bacterium]|nr:SCP2 sterol-binding domain-containing protein [Gammaproteobacteria bacterium]